MALRLGDDIWTYFGSTGWAHLILVFSQAGIWNWITDKTTQRDEMDGHDFDDIDTTFPSTLSLRSFAPDTLVVTSQFLELVLVHSYNHTESNV